MASQPLSESCSYLLVAHDGVRWLPAVLTALHRSGRRPDRMVAVDTGSTDGTAELLAKAEAAGLVDRVVTLGRETGFGAAVAAALATGCSKSVKAPEETTAAPAELVRAFADAGTQTGELGLV